MKRFTIAFLFTLSSYTWAADPALLKQADAAWAARENDAQTLEAISLWQKTLQSDSNNLDLYIKLTKACGRAVRHSPTKSERQKWADQAREYGEKAVALAPENPEALTVYGEALGQWARSHKLHGLGAVKQSVAALEKAVKIKPDHAFAHMLLAEIYTHAPGGISVGNKTKGFEHAREGARLKNAYAINHLVLARILIERGEKEEAKKELNTILAMTAPADAVPETKADQETARKLLETL